MSSHVWEPRERGRAVAFAAVLLGAILYPLRQNWRDCKTDGFPLSYYPMFSARRCQHQKVHYAVGIHTDGSRHYLDHYLLGSGGLNQARRQLNRVVKREQEADFVVELAARVAADPEHRDVARVEIVRGEFDLDVCLLDHRLDGTETVLAEADIPEHTAPHTEARKVPR